MNVGTETKQEQLKTMSNTKALIIDDEPAALEALKMKLEMYCENVEVVAICNSAKAGLQAINEHKPDLIFLDIEMPWMNGFEMLDCLGDKIDFDVVFVTAYDQYAVRAFKTMAMDYLLKPVDKDDLLSFATKFESSKLNQEKLNELKQHLNHPQNNNRILIKSAESIDVVDTTDIMCCQADSNYTYIFTSDGRKIVASKALNSLEKVLDPDAFVRIHRSYLINLAYVTKFNTSEGYEVTLKNGQTFPVSRRKKDELLESLSSYH